MPGHSPDALTPSWFTRELGPGDSGDDVRVVQRRIGLPATGIYDETTERSVRGLQRKEGLPMTGNVDRKTASRVGERKRKGQVPEWFTRDLALGDHGDDVAELNALLGLSPLHRFEPDLEAAILREQSARGLALTGVADAELVSDLAKD